MNVSFALLCPMLKYLGYHDMSELRILGRLMESALLVTFRL